MSLIRTARPSGAFLEEQCRAEGPDHLRFVGNDNRHLQIFFQQMPDATVPGHPTGEKDRATGPEPPDHARCPLDYCLVQTEGDIFAIFSPADQRGDFRFGKDGAHGVDGQQLAGLEGGGAEFSEGKIQGLGHDFEEFAGAGGAAVVHLEALDLSPRAKDDALAVLAADIEDGRRLGEEMAGAAAVGLDLGHDFRVIGDFEQIAAITGGHDPVESDAFQDLLDLPSRIEGCGSLTNLSNCPIFNDDALNRSRSDVYPCAEHSCIRFLSRVDGEQPLSVVAVSALPVSVGHLPRRTGPGERPWRWHSADSDRQSGFFAAMHCFPIMVEIGVEKDLA